MSLFTAAEFRAYYNEVPARLDRLTASERKTVEYDANGYAPKGRIAPGAIAKARGKAKGYAPGNTHKVEVATAKANAAARAKAAKAGHTGTRGPLPLKFRPSI